MTKKKPYVRLKPKLDTAGEGYPLPMRGLLAMGKPQDGASYAEWADTLRGYVPDLIRMALDPGLNNRKEHDKAVWAPYHALCVLAELEAAEGVEPLLEMLDWDDDWINHALAHFYGAVGSAGVSALEDYLADPGNSERAKGIALECLGQVARTHPDQRDEVVRFLVAFLDRPGADAAEAEALTAWTIAELGDLKAAEALPAIRRAFDEDRVDATVVGLEEIEMMMSKTPDETGSEDVKPAGDFAGDFDEAALAERPLSLTLKCKACGREREYTFDRAYFDVGIAPAPEQHVTQADRLLIPERVVCRKCGAVDQYELAGLSTLAILSKLVASRGGLPDPLPRLELVQFTTERWGWVPPKQVLPRYEAEVAAHPDDVNLRLGYANLLRKLGYRERAVEEYERVLLAHPNHGDALFSIAQMQAEFGTIPDAIAAYEALARRFGELSVPPDEREMRREEIESCLAELRAGVRPGYQGKTIPIDRPAQGVRPGINAQRPPPRASERPHAAEEPARPAQSPYGKVGRNEPCPCGSGKKYKQCHGRK